jgi:hypothetical protein
MGNNKVGGRGDLRKDFLQTGKSLIKQQILLGA